MDPQFPLNDKKYLNDGRTKKEVEQIVKFGEDGKSFEGYYLGANLGLRTLLYLDKLSNGRRWGATKRLKVEERKLK